MPFDSPHTKLDCGTAVDWGKRLETLLRENRSRPKAVRDTLHNIASQMLNKRLSPEIAYVKATEELERITLIPAWMTAEVVRIMADKSL